MPKPKYLSDEWYVSRGAKPPEHIQHGNEEDILAKMASVKHGQWTQRGNMVFCGVCPTHHGSPVPLNALLQGTDTNGYPTFKVLDA